MFQLGEAALDRALNGTATAVFFQGEQIGERVRYDERLTMFVLRMRDPQRYGKWRDAALPVFGPEVDAARLHLAIARVSIDASSEEEGVAPRRWPALMGERLLSPREAEAREMVLAQEAVDREEKAEDARYWAAVDAEDAAEQLAADLDK